MNKGIKDMKRKEEKIREFWVKWENKEKDN
jgi:hypothetical protein